MRSTSAIVVSYNKRPYTELCVGGMLRCTPPPAQIVVVDNGSSDGSVEFLKMQFVEQCRNSQAECAVITNAENVGACTARNQALEEARGEYIAFCDNDVTVRSRDWLAKLSSSLDEMPEVGIVGPKLLFPFAPYDIECAGVGISRSGRVQYCGRGQARDTPEFCQARKVQCLTSACWLMRRELYEQLGGLDELFNPAQFEDFDYCYRAREAGWEVLYQPAAEMYHFENVTTDGSRDVNFKYVTMKNWRVFRQRWEHMFSGEDGPADAECKWAEIRTRALEEVGEPPMK